MAQPLSQLAILYPVCALAFWTFSVLLIIPFVRVRASLRREVTPDDFRHGESAAVPAYVRMPNRNYMNLLELPVLFYVVCLLLYVTDGADIWPIRLAWGYVGLRVLHSLIHLSYNAVLHRLAAFASSNFVLLAMWVMALLHLQRLA
jgi:hypothetical protein